MSPLALRAAAAAVLLALALPAAAAGATWSAPQDLSSAHTFVDQPSLVFSGDGTALASWEWMDGFGNDGVAGVGAASRRADAVAFGHERTLAPGRRFAGRPLTVSGPLAYGEHRALLATSRRTADAGGDGVRLAVRFGGPGGHFGPAHTVRRARLIARPQLAVNGRGAAALAWLELAGAHRVYVSLRRAGGGFGPPVRVAAGAIETAAVAIGRRGDVLVAWEGFGQIHARFKLRSEDWQAVDRVHTLHRAFGAELHPVVTRTGRGVLAWSSQFADEGGDRGPIFVQAATRPAHGDRFRHAQTLDRLDETQLRGPIDHVLVGGGPKQRSAVAWTGFDGANRRVIVSVTDTGGRFRVPQDVSPAGSDGVVSDLAAGPGGRMLVVWDAGGSGANRVQAALAPAPLQPFGAPEAVSPAQEARAGRAAFDPFTGVPTVVWSNRPAGSAGPTAGVRSFAQAATRLGGLSDR